ncbi:transposase [Yinghuangia soli]|uniref:Transposase n=1 Tax=Yinghuangia soli TaxID=2908204 RepID=A0AA41Q9J2_9ACTN|nr:transposase [Yinghuangia soli]MCF2534079.1 transposase [Yinghuangia soli]
MAVVSAADRELVPVFTGLTYAQFRALVRVVQVRGGHALDPARPGRPWALPLEDRVLIVAFYLRTNLTMRQLGPLFGVSHAAAHRIVDKHSPLLALDPPRAKPRAGEVLIVDGTLVPTRDRTVAASSKNYRFSTNLQVLVHADTRLVVAVGRPLPGNRNDCRAFSESGVDTAAGEATVIADGGYQGTGCLIPHRRRPGEPEVAGWRAEHNRDHRKVRARVEHVFARMKNWKALRDCRRKGDGVFWAVSAVARMHNLAMTG